MRRTVWALATVCLLVQVVGIAFEPALLRAIGLLMTCSFVGVGMLITARRPENPIGWLYLGFGATAALHYAAGAYAEHALVTDPGSLPAADVAASLGVHLLHPGFGFLVF